LHGFASICPPTGLSSVLPQKSHGCPPETPNSPPTFDSRRGLPARARGIDIAEVFQHALEPDPIAIGGARRRAVPSNAPMRVFYWQRTRAKMRIQDGPARAGREDSGSTCDFFPALPHSSLSQALDEIRFFFVVLFFLGAGSAQISHYLLDEQHRWVVMTRIGLKPNHHAWTICPFVSGFGRSNATQQKRKRPVRAQSPNLLLTGKDASPGGGPHASRWLLDCTTRTAPSIKESDVHLLSTDLPGENERRSLCVPHQIRCPSAPL